MKQEDQIPGQMSIFDFLAMPSGRTSKEPCQVTTEMTLEWYLKKCADSKTKMPMFLDLRGGASGNSADASWVTAIPWLGDSIMRSISEYHKEDEDYVFSLISMDTQQLNWFLNLSEKPIIPRPSKLSEILDLNCDLEKYMLSIKACQGILNRARKRNKKLPEILEYALIKQSSEGGAVSFQERSGKPGGGKGILIQDEHTGTLSTLNNQSVVYGISPYASNAMLSKNPNSEIYKADTARTLDLNGGNPACNQGGMAVVQNVTFSDTAASRLAQDERGGVHSQMMSDPEGNFVVTKTVCIGGGQLHDAMTPSEEVSKCLNCLDDTMKVLIEHKCIGNGQVAQLGLHEKALTLDCMHDQQAILSYGLDRASFNQGQNAKFDFAVEKEKSPTLVAKGPGGGISDTVGSLCARDYKGVGNQYVDEGKVIVQYVKEDDTRH